MKGRVVMLLAAFFACGSCSSESVNEPVGQREQRLATTLDPLVRMPGTQPGEATLDDPRNCINCHGGYNPQVEPTFNWQGSMMAQAARDPLFWTAMTVAAQDSLWALGRPNATDLCERCHFPSGWIAGRSDPTNASAMIGADFDGVHCDACHKLYDPHFDATYNGTREGNDWVGYWDETGASQTPSAAAAAATHTDDAAQAAGVTYFNGNAFYASNAPIEGGYTEATGGQYYFATSAEKRASFADAGAKHSFFYSRFHKSRYLCGTCHDVSNPALANLAYADLAPGDGTTVLPSEQQAAHAYYHVERTFSEFTLSAYGQQGGAAGVGPFSPSSFTTSQPGNVIATCQDCHMRDVRGVGCDKNSAVFRPDESVEHPKSGQPLHDLTGGNIFISYLLASATAGSANYDATNAQLLGQGATTLTLDLQAGLGIDPVALLAGVERAKEQLGLAASIADLTFDAPSRSVSFKVQNQTGHKLISGFPEGRRMFVNVKAYLNNVMVYELNPYDASVGTLKGLDPALSPSSPPLTSTEGRDDHLVYEMNPSSTLTGEDKTFHFVLADGRYKDNRIPPRGFNTAGAVARLVEPVYGGIANIGYFTADEYAGGYDEVELTVPFNADRVEVALYYQTTSREYIEFLRHQIAGTPSRQTLPSDAYVAQTDPFFDRLRAWGETMWQLWDLNKDVPGAAPFLMASAAAGASGPPPCEPPTPTMMTAVTVRKGENTVEWSDEHSGDPSVTGYTLYYDQAGKSLLVTSLGLVATYTDTGLTDGQTYCYKVTAVTSDCESELSNIVCGTPVRDDGDVCTSPTECSSGYCVDGRCCNSACGGLTDDCQACSIAAGAVQDGVCGDVSDGWACTINSAAGTCSGGLCDPTPDAGVPDATVDAGVPDATVDTGIPVDSTVDTGIPVDSTVDTLSADSTVDTLSADSTVDTLSADSTVDVGGSVDSTVDAGVSDSTVDASAEDATVDVAGADAMADSDSDQSAPDAGVDAGDAGLDASSADGGDLSATDASSDAADGAPGDALSDTGDAGPSDQAQAEAGPSNDLGGDMTVKESGGCSCRTGGSGGDVGFGLLLLAFVLVSRRRPSR